MITTPPTPSWYHYYLRPPGGVVITRVCWFVACVRCDFSAVKSDFREIQYRRSVSWEVHGKTAALKTFQCNNTTVAYDLRQIRQSKSNRYRATTISNFDMKYKAQYTPPADADETKLFCRVASAVCTWIRDDCRRIRRCERTTQPWPSLQSYSCNKYINLSCKFSDQTDSIRMMQLD